MALNREREIQVKFFVNDEELKCIELRMKISGISNRSHFLRKMALSGYILQLQLPEINRLLMLMSNTTSNLNQISRKVNSGGNLLGADIDYLRQDYDRIWNMLNEILIKMMDFKNGI